MSPVTVTQPAGTTTPGHEPAWYLGELPVYKTGQAPRHLRSATQIVRGLGLQLAPGQRPVCYVLPFFHPDEPCALYDPAQALPVPRSVGDEWAWRQRRTCPRCGSLREHVLHGHECGACWQADQERLREKRTRTCEECRRIGRKPYPQVQEGWYSKRLCRFCAAARKRKLNALLAEAALCPGGCGKKTAAKKTVLAWSLDHRRAVQHWPRKYCPPCDEAHIAEQERAEAERQARWEKARAEQAERDRAARAARSAEVAQLAAWAREALADPDTVILDTETTGLSDDARIVDIAVTTASGEVLLDTLINPGEPIPASATGIHGITDTDVADAPTFAQILPRLTDAVAGKRVLVYNLSYDDGRLHHELGLAGADAAAWRGQGRTRWEDAMVPYSDWYGDWSEYWGNYSWQPLNGGHRALGDCLAVIDCLKAMARDTRADDEEQAA